MQRTERLHPHPSPQQKHVEDYDITDAVRFAKADFGKLILRINIGGLMLFHGVNKLVVGTEQVGQLLQNVGLPAFFSFGVLVGEIVAPIMLILGYKVRLAGFLIAVDMFMAVLLAHSSEFFRLTEGGGWMMELNALYFFGSIALMFLGSGKFAVTKGRGYLD